MSVFLSWSGDLSLRVAMVLKDWLRTIMPDVELFVSTEDIAKGQRWNAELASHLAKSSHGILCLTPQNITASWLNFEAGALSQALDETHVIPFLFGLQHSDVRDGPLGQFQCTRYDKADVKRMVRTLATLSTLSSLDNTRLNVLFDALWPSLQEQLDALIPATSLALERRSEHVRPMNRVERDLALGSARDRILKARNSVWLSGSTLNVAAGDTWRGYELTQARMQIILPDYTDDRVVWATAVNDNATVQRQRAYMELAVSVLSDAETGGGPVELYLLPYCPSYSYFAVDANREDQSDGFISIELQGYHFSPSATPNITFFEDNEKHREFFDYFAGIWNEMIDDARRIV